MARNQLTAQEANDLMAANPQRTDVYFLYQKDRQVTAMRWTVDGFWDVYSGVMRFSFSKNADGVFFQMVDDVPVDPTPTAKQDNDMPSKQKLTAAQERPFERVYRLSTYTLERFTNGMEYRVLVNLCAKGLVQNNRASYASEGEFTLTEAGQQLARELFGSSTPETVASAAPVAANDTESPVADADIPFASFDSESTSDNAAMPIETPITAQIQAVDSIQAYPSVKAPKTPVMTKKERRKREQAEIRQRYSIAQEQKRLYREQGMAAVFEFSRRMVAINSQMAALDLGKAA